MRGPISGMVAIGLVAQQVVDEEMARRAVEPRVEMERALPAPDVEVGIVPDRRAPGEVAAHLPEDDPLAAALVPDRQLLRRDEQVVADLEDRRPADRDGQDDHRDGGQERASQATAAVAILACRVKLRKSERPGDPTIASRSATATAIATPGDRQEVIVLPVEAREGDLDPGRERPAGDQASPRVAAGAECQIGHGTGPRPARAASFRSPTRPGNRSCRTARGACPWDRRCR